MPAEYKVSGNLLSTNFPFAPKETADTTLLPPFSLPHPTPTPKPKVERTKKRDDDKQLKATEKKKDTEKE